MQTAKTQHTLLLHPYRFSIFDLDSLHRTVSFTQMAANTCIFHMEMAGSSSFAVGRIRQTVHQIWYSACHLIAGNVRCYFGDHTFNLCICFLIDLLHFLRIMKIKHRRPGIRHVHTERTAHMNAAGSEQPSGIFAGKARCCAIACHQKYIRRLVTAGKLQTFQKCSDK